MGYFSLVYFLVLVRFSGRLIVVSMIIVWQFQNMKVVRCGKVRVVLQVCCIMYSEVLISVYLLKVKIIVLVCNGCRWLKFNQGRLKLRVGQVSCVVIYMLISIFIMFQIMVVIVNCCIILQWYGVLLLFCMMFFFWFQVVVKVVVWKGWFIDLY